MVWIWNTDPSIKHACIIAILKSINMILAPIPSYFFLKKLLLSKQMPNQLDLKETEFQMDSRNKAEHTHSTSQYAVDLESTKQACTQCNSNLNRTLQN